MRIQAAYGSRDELELEKLVPMLPAIVSSRRGEITRLAAPVGVDPFIRLALWKAGYLYCTANNIRWLVMGVRKPALIRAYEAMGARDILKTNVPCLLHMLVASRTAYSRLIPRVATSIGAPPTILCFNSWQRRIIVTSTPSTISARPSTKNVGLYVV